MKLIYKGDEYPKVIDADMGYEKQIVLIPEASGDYFLAVIDSCGSYEVLESVAKSDVDILIGGE